MNPRPPGCSTEGVAPLHTAPPVPVKRHQCRCCATSAGVFALLDPDPATQINTDPDPKPRYKQCSRSAWICNEIFYFDLLDLIFFTLILIPTVRFQTGFCTQVGAISRTPAISIAANHFADKMRNKNIFSISAYWLANNRRKKLPERPSKANWSSLTNKNVKYAPVQ